MILINDCRVKAIVLDLDGTLLDTSGNIDKGTNELLTKIYQRGVKIIIATSRSRRSVINVLPISFPYNAAIFDNGADYCVSKIFTATNYIEEEVVKKIYVDLTDMSAKPLIACEVRDTLHANFDISKFWKGTNYIRTAGCNLPSCNVKRILAFNYDCWNVSEFGLLFDCLKNICQLYITDRKHLIQIIKKGNSKYMALCKILEYWNMALNDVVSFGDDYPDIDLVKNCGIGVAMDNAVDELKQVSDYVTGSNSDCGVKTFLEKYIVHNWRNVDGIEDNRNVGKPNC